MKKVGFFAGTFDPIHEGHLEFARTCMKDLSLDKIIFLPEKTPRNKVDVTNVAIRINEIEHSVQSEDNFEVRLLNQDKFTIKDTIPILEGWYPHTRLVLLLGSDVVQYLSLWPDLSILSNSVSLAIGMRSQQDEGDIRTILNGIVIPRLRYTIHHTNMAHLSSSQIREIHNISSWSSK